MDLMLRNAFLDRIWRNTMFHHRIAAACLWLVLFFTQNLYAYNPYTTRELDELEKEFANLIHQSNQVLRNPLAMEYINHLGKRLASQNDINLPYFFIVKSNEINAFAGPGGYIAINSQLILATENESELAAVMAHEIAHVRLHHLYRMLEHQKQMRVPMLASVLASLALGVINPTLGGGALMASLTGLAQDNINFTRANEKEADRIGIDMLIRSGIDPRGMAGFFKKMQQNSRYYFSDLPPILRTHPLDDDRIAEAENRCQNLKQKIYPNDLNYPLFKELIRNLTGQDTKQLLDYYTVSCQKESKQACQYGYALALIKAREYQKAEKKLLPLYNLDTDNFYYALALAETKMHLNQTSDAWDILNRLYVNYPESYAVLLAYADVLMNTGKAHDAENLLLKASRKFKNDLPVCQQLARSQAKANHKGYAYFTRAQCELIKGNKKQALNQLNIAKKIDKKDRFLQARIEAKIEEIKESL